jgi:hypothetical protein
MGNLAVLDTGWPPLENVAEAQPTLAVTFKSDIASEVHNMERQITLAIRVEGIALSCILLLSSWLTLMGIFYLTSRVVSESRRTRYRRL